MLDSLLDPVVPAHDLGGKFILGLVFRELVSTDSIGPFPQRHL
jgi:hypothetical protein